MPWCPKCKAEYREGFTECSTCRVPLVDTLPEENEENKKPEEFVLPDGMEKPIAVYRWPCSQGRPWPSRWRCCCCIWFPTVCKGESAYAVVSEV